MDYRSRSRRFCSWCAHRLPPALRVDAVYCSGRCRMAARRAVYALRDAGMERPRRDGYPQGEPAPVGGSPGWHRQEVESALLRLAGKAIGVMSAALAQNDTSVAEWIVERAVVRPGKPNDPREKSARMRDDEARAELQHRIASIAAQLEAESHTGAVAGSG